MSIAAKARSRRSMAVVALATIAALAAVGAVGAAAQLSAGATSKTAAAVADDSRARNDSSVPLSGASSSAVEPALARRLVSLGEAVVRADVTGVGRAAFPGYWSPGAYAACCTAVRVAGAAAMPSATHPGDVDVTVIWDAVRSDGGPALRNQQSIVHMHRTLIGWEPIPDPTTALSP